MIARLTFIYAIHIYHYNFLICEFDFRLWQNVLDKPYCDTIYVWFGASFCFRLGHMFPE